MRTPTIKSARTEDAKSERTSKPCIPTYDDNNSVWVERKVNFAGGQRSYFQSFKTGSCTWDEPPPGVTRVVKAHDLSRYPQLALYISTEASLPTRPKARGWFKILRRK